MTPKRYSRLKRFSGMATTLERWQAAACGVAGLGGLGGGLALALARYGVRRLILADRDLVEAENLGHQALYTERQAEAGLPKAQAAVETLSAVNSGVEYVPRVAEITRLSVDGLFSDASMIFDGLDNYYARLVLNDYALSTKTPYFYAGVVRGELSARAVVPGVTGCLRCLIDKPPAPGDVPTCSAEGVFAPLLGVANALQIDAANRWLAGGFGVNDDVMYSLRLPGWELRKLQMNGPRADCPACQGRYEYLDGTLDNLAAHACSPGRASVELNRPVDLTAVAAVLETGEFALTQNRYCLAARDGERHYTVFRDGRIVVEGGGPAELNRFIATYLGT